jgi:hypothetical protein
VNGSISVVKPALNVRGPLGVQKVADRLFTPSDFMNREGPVHLRKVASSLGSWSYSGLGYIYRY